MKLDAVGLEEVWTFLEFVGKNFLRESVDLKQQRNEWLEAIRKPESQADDEHCLCKRYREDRTIPPSDRIDLLLLAGWDLLRLLSRVYDDLVPPKSPCLRTATPTVTRRCWTSSISPGTIPLS